MDYTEQLRAAYGADTYATETTGIVILEAKENYARCGLRIEPRHKNAGGHVMGGVYFTLADFAFAVAAGGAKMDMVTLSSSVQFLSAARGDYLTAETRCVKMGRSTCVMDVTVCDGDRPVVVVTSTGMRVK